MANVQEIRVPDIGGFADIEIIEVLVKPGDQVKAEDSLITLESDKASMEIPSPNAGVIKDLRVKLGDRISEGDVILSLEVAEENISEITASTSTTKPAASESKTTTAVVETPDTTTSVISAGKNIQIPVAGKQESPTQHINEESFKKAHASPAVRRFARELGADLGLISGTGPKARILEGDVKAFVKQSLNGSGAAYAGAAPAGAGIPKMPEIDFSKWGDVEITPLKRIKKLSGANLHRNWLNVPHVTHHDDADVTDLEAFRASLKAEAEKRGVRITSLAFIMKAVANTMLEYPQFNTSLSTDGQSLVHKKYLNLGIAVDTPNGLVVPVFRNVDKKSIYDLSNELAEVSSRARDGKLKPDEMQGGCMTISSLGGIGGFGFTPIVNAPEVAILGITRSRMTPVWNGKEFTPRLMMPLDLSYDHRVIDGAEAARFMAFLCQALGDVRRLLL